jgi:hypothetical protein
MITGTSIVASIIHSFDGTPIEGAVSSSGVFAAFDWRRLALPPIDTPIIRKSRANADARLRGFPLRDHHGLKETLGHYSDVQSLSSEDTVTWSVFGFADQEGWLNDILTEMFGPAERPELWNLELWSRIRHPDTGQVEHGPESDVVIERDTWRYVIEAKWTSDISSHKNGQTQIDMRAYQAQMNGAPPEKSGVIVIAPSPARYRCATTENSLFRRYFAPLADCYAQLDPARELNAQALTWERLVDVIGGRGRPQLQDYIDWRLSLVR